MCRSSYKEILEEVNNEKSLITYFELLHTTEWFEKRNKIIARDNHVCQLCKKGQTITRYSGNKKEYLFVTIPDNSRYYKVNYVNDGEADHFIIYDDRDFIFTPSPRHSYLHVHHTYYKLDLLPWEYKSESLITLCVHCHFHLHETTRIPVYINDIEKTFLTPCSRCNGAGILPQFDYYMNGICFNCWGAKYNELINSEMKKRSKEVYERMKSNASLV